LPGIYTIDGLDYARKLGQDAVAGGINEAPVMLVYKGVDLAMRGKGVQRRLFIFPA
jgi:hypothetical protein